jgi:succinoglycan biosynthesis transport protein ExoP
MDNPFITENGSFSEDLRRYFALLWRWGWVIALATLLAAVTAYLISRRMTPIYQASTTLLINEAPANRTTDYSSILTSERLAQTYTEMLSKNPVLQAVIDELGLSMQTRDLQKMIDVQMVRDTQLIEVKVDNPDPVLAAKIANVLVARFADQTQTLQASRYSSSKQNLETQLARIDDQIQTTSEQIAALGDASENTAERDRLETALAQYRQTYATLLQSYEQVRVAEAGSTSNVVQIESAGVPEAPIRPRKLVNTALAGMVGLMFSVGAVFLIEALDDTIKGPEDITRTMGLPVLGIITRHETQDGQLITMAEPRSPVSEAFRAIRTNLQFASVDKPIQKLLVTSPSPADGKTTVAANLGVAMAQGGKKVALIDADMRRPRIHKVMDIPNRMGLSSLFVQSEISLDGSMQKTKSDGLYIITSGDLPPNPAELLGSDKLAEILNMVAKETDLVILDSPPIVAVTDSAVLAHRVDGVIVVVKPGVTKLAAARQAVDQLQRVGANVLGVVLNDVDFGQSRYRYYQYKGYDYSYRTYYDETGKKIRRRLHKDKKGLQSEPQGVAEQEL